MREAAVEQPAPQQIHLFRDHAISEKLANNNSEMLSLSLTLIAEKLWPCVCLLKNRFPICMEIRRRPMHIQDWPDRKERNLDVKKGPERHWVLKSGSETQISNLVSKMLAKELACYRILTDDWMSSVHTDVLGEQCTKVWASNTSHQQRCRDAGTLHLTANSTELWSWLPPFSTVYVQVIQQIINCLTEFLKLQSSSFFFTQQLVK